MTWITLYKEAISALETAKKSGIAFIDNPGHAQVKNCIEKVEALNEALNEAGKWIIAFFELAGISLLLSIIWIAIGTTISKDSKKTDKKIISRIS